MASLHKILRDNLKLSDEVFAKACGLNRSQVHRYRTGRAIPRGDHQQKVVEALVRLGVEMEAEEIGALFKPPPSVRRSATKAA